jgi:hypothetical protein
VPPYPYCFFFASFFPFFDLSSSVFLLNFSFSFSSPITSCSVFFTAVDFFCFPSCFYFSSYFLSSLLPSFYHILFAFFLLFLVFPFATFALPLQISFALSLSFYFVLPFRFFVCSPYITQNITHACTSGSLRFCTHFRAC